MWISVFAAWVATVPSALQASVDYLLPDMIWDNSGREGPYRVYTRSMPYIKALAMFRRALGQLTSLISEALTSARIMTKAYTLHLKVAILSWACQLDLQERHRSDQGHSVRSPMRTATPIPSPVLSWHTKISTSPKPEKFSLTYWRTHSSMRATIRSMTVTNVSSQTKNRPAIRTRMTPKTSPSAAPDEPAILYIKNAVTGKVHAAERLAPSETGVSLWTSHPSSALFQSADLVSTPSN